MALVEPDQPRRSRVARRTVLWTTPMVLAAVPAPVFAAFTCTAPDLSYTKVAWTMGAANVNTPAQDGVTGYGSDGASRFLSVADANPRQTGTVSYAVMVSLQANTTYRFAFTCAANFGSNDSTRSTGQSMSAQINSTSMWTGSTRAALGGTLITPSTNGNGAITSGSFTYTPTTTGIVTFRYFFTIQPPANGGCDDIGVSAPTITC